MDETRKFALAAYPLAWPEGWKRTPSHMQKYPHFKNEGSRLRVGGAIGRVLSELTKMGISRDDCLISTNLQTRLDGLPRADQREPLDPGAAVWFRKGQNGAMRCIATDQYKTVAGNLGALAATLEAMRAIQRHGSAEILERTFTGFAALPAKASQPWRDVLGVAGAVTASLVEARFRELSKLYHPDIVGGDREKFEAIVQARKDALQELS